MTNEEAIHRITYHNRVHHLSEPRAVYITEALQMAIEALEKQIPKAAEHEDGAWSICPNCGGSICNDTEHATNKEVSYCEHCGQAIDWENSEME